MGVDPGKKLFFLLGPVAVFPKLSQDYGAVKPEEDAEGQRDSLDDDPSNISVKLNLIRSCINLEDRTKLV